MPVIDESKYLVQAGWDDVPHLDKDTKRKLLAAIQPHLRDARTKGTPSLGAGAIYPVGEEDIVCAPFVIPDYWPKAYGFDVGWNKTAAIWGAHDRDNDVVYLYTEHYRGQAEPVIHTTAIQARGDWIPGVIDPASGGRSQKDGDKLFEEYQGLGLDIEKANNSVEAGLHQVWMRLATGRLKVFSTCQNFLAEYRIYRRDENGKVIKKYDHLMDATRYLIISGIELAIVKPVLVKPTGSGVVVADSVTGY